MPEVPRALQNVRRPQAEVRRWELGAIRFEPEDTAASLAETLLREAGETLARAKAQKVAVEQEREQILGEAHLQGLQEGRAQAAAESAALQQELQRLIEELPGGFERFCLAQAPALIQLCVEAVEKILLEQLTLEPERVVVIVRSAIAHIPHSQRLVIQVHPEDLPLLQEATLTQGRLSHELILEPDPQLQRGGCRIESRQGVVDASLEGALVRLSGILTED